MQLARRARARPDTGLSGTGAAGQPADSWSRWSAAFGPSWVCRSPCAPRFPAPLSPTLYGEDASLVSVCDLRVLKDFPPSDAAPSGPLIYLPGTSWRSVVPPSPREGTAATQPDRRPPTTRRSQLGTRGLGAPAPAPATDWARTAQLARDAFPAQPHFSGDPPSRGGVSHFSSPPPIPF